MMTLRLLAQTLSLLLLACGFCRGGESTPSTPAAPQPPVTAPLTGKIDRTPPGTERARNWEGKVIVIPVKGPIAPEKMGGCEEKILTAITDAAGAKLIVLEVDTPGGVIDSCDHLCGALLQSKAPVYALVLRKAVSGGSMLSTACKRIYMLTGSRIGDCQPMSMMPGQQMDDRTIEKIESDVRAIMAANARANGYPVALLEAMVSRSLQIYEVRYEGSLVSEFLKQEQYDLLKKNMAEGLDKRTFAADFPKVIDEKDKILSLAAQDAQRLGLAKAVLENEPDFYKLLEIDPTLVLRADVPDGDLDILKSIGVKDLKLGKWLIFLLILCLAAGIAGALAEMHMPGFGVPGAISIIGFTSFFYILFMYDRASPFEIILFITGLALLVIEIVVLPGFGVPGIVGCCLLLLGLGLALLPDFNTPYMQQFFWSEVTVAGAFVLSAAVLSIALFIFVFERGGKIPFLKGIFLAEEQTGGLNGNEPAAISAAADLNEAVQKRQALVGKGGVALTMLRPAGKVRLDDGGLLDVVTEGAFVEAGTRVKIIEADLSRFVVIPDTHA